MSFDDLDERVAEVRERIAAAIARGGHAQQVTIVAVTKSHGPDAVQAAWRVGIGDVGENRIQEALAKMASVDVPVAWHMVGRLQRNKVKAVDRFALVHSIDSPPLADAVHEVGLARQRPVDALLQINVSGETSKGGFASGDVAAEAERLAGRFGIRLVGVMTLAPFGAGERELRRVFAGARAARELLAAAGHPALGLSMGMSGDYEVAVEEGATMVRLGTVLFGPRET